MGRITPYDETEAADSRAKSVAPASSPTHYRNLSWRHTSSNETA